MNILIVEDDPVIRQELKILLENSLYHAEALEQFDRVDASILERNPDLVLLDLNLPQESGFAICTKVRAKSDVPIIFLTSRTDSADELNGILKGGDDYINCPLDKEQYERFVTELVWAEKAVLHEFEKREIFEGCMPVEVMAARGKDTLRFGMLKPVGLEVDGVRPYAVLQLRKENEAGTAYGLVGFQTNLKFKEQKRVFSLIPALAHAEFERYGVMHRNTYLQSPELLNADYSVKGRPELFFAGQITGVEGYVESAMSGLLAGIHAYRRLCGKQTVVPEDTCMCGALSRYIAQANRRFDPMNANYGILRAGFENVRDKKEKKKLLGVRALEEIERFCAEIAER